VVLICLSLDFLGIGLTIPTLTPLLKDADANLFRHETSQQFRDTMYLLLSGLFFFGTFIGAPVIGMMSDKYGRRKMILFTAGCTVLSTTLVMIGIFTKVMALLFIGRLVAGLFSGMLIILQSTIADVSKPEEKAKNFGLVGIAFGIGFAIGPIIGTVIEQKKLSPYFGYHMPYLVATIINLINFIFIWLTYPETLHQVKQQAINYFKSIHNIKSTWNNRELRNVFLVILVLATGFSLFIQYFQAMLINNFHFTQNQQGASIIYVGVWIAIAQGLVLRLLLRKFQAWQILMVSIPLMGIAFVLLNMTSSPVLFFAIAPLLALCQGCIFPALLAIISNKVSDDVQGEVIGINQSFQALASSMPLLLAVVTARYPSFVFYFGACCSFIGFALYLFKLNDYRNKEAANVGAD